MIMLHRTTGEMYRLLFTAWNVEDQRHNMVYMKLETGQLFTRSYADLEPKFAVMDLDPQQSLEPRENFEELDEEDPYYDQGN